MIYKIMTAGIKYEDEELKFFTDCETVEDYLEVLRHEVRQNANKRTYEFYIGQAMKPLALFKNGVFKRFDK